MKKVPNALIVGSLMYAMVCTRSDITHAMGVVSRMMSNLDQEYWRAVKSIFRYLRGTTGHALWYGGDDVVLRGYIDTDMVGDTD